ncbi:MAG TPA: DUF1326 domain-containing protein [Ktedonobacterales bacterium]|jgi:hypothetical protein|nr:DUF1326 domain-containing protein [Ktedonobacterales bacterium]
MASTPWQISGQYFETCSCDFLCPCITSNLAARPTQGSCTVAIALHVEQGQFGGTDLAGHDVVVVAYTPEEMGKGNWTVGLVIDDGASNEQQQALTAIASGQAGGPMAALGPLIGTFAGVEVRPVQFQQNGLKWSISIPGLLDQVADGAIGANQSDAMYLENVPHPVNTRIGLAKAERSHIHAFGIDWDADSGATNGHFAPFSWQGA